MLPLRDSIRAERRPLVCWALILANVAAFAWEVQLGPQLPGVLQIHGLVPARVLHEGTWSLDNLEQQVGPLFTHMFLHGGWLHLIGNLWFLHVFGDNVEGRLGHLEFLLFYAVCGLGAAAGQVLAGPDSWSPMVGASGAIAGILGAYMVLFPRARILTLVPGFIVHLIGIGRRSGGPWIEVPAVFFLGFWALIQFFRGTAELVGGATQGVAWWAHVGGFAVGAALALGARRRRR